MSAWVHFEGGDDGYVVCSQRALFWDGLHSKMSSLRELEVSMSSGWVKLLVDIACRVGMSLGSVICKSKLAIVSIIV